MRFWDSSALIPLAVHEASTERMLALRRDDTSMVVWWGTIVECRAAIVRLERRSQRDPEAVREARARLQAVADSWTEVPATGDVRDQASRLVRLHPLRAGDALQLAAALVAAELKPRTLPFVTLDERLAEVADLEGFPVLR